MLKQPGYGKPYAYRCMSIKSKFKYKGKCADEWFQKFTKLFTKVVKIQYVKGLNVRNYFSLDTHGITN